MISKKPAKAPKITKNPVKRRFLIVTYDVKKLTDDKINSLVTKAEVLAESRDGPCVPVCYEFVDSRE